MVLGKSAAPSPLAGTTAVRFTAKVKNAGPARGVAVLHDGLDVKIGDGTKLTYLLRPDTDQGTKARVDLVVKDAAGAESTLTLGSDSEPIAKNRWNSVTVDLSDHVGETVTKVLVRAETDNASAGAEMNGFIDNLTIATTPLGPDSQWRFFDAGTNPSAGSPRLSWAQPGFDDSTWNSGEGAFWALKSGSTMSDTLSKVTNMNWGSGATAIPAYFFRTSFDLSAQDFDGIRGGYAFVAYDDTVTVYVNGSKVAGFGDKDITSNTQYQNISGQGDPLRQVISIPKELLKEGANVVAVEVHQCNSTSSDAYFYMPNLVLTPSYLSVPFTSDDLDHKYPSDTRPVGPNGGDYQVEMLSDFNNLMANYPNILAPNTTIVSQTPTAQNDKTVVNINNNGTEDQRAKAMTDAYDSPHRAMADGFGPILGPLYAKALKEGRLPKVDKLVGGRIEKTIADHEPAKSAYNYKRPFVRMGFQGSGGQIVQVDSMGGYNGLSGNGSFPSGHTNHGYSQGTILATLVPQVADSMMLRSSEYGFNRMILAYHYPLDVLGSTMIGQDVASMRWSDPEFQYLLNSAKAEIQSVLSEDCGTATIDQCLENGGVSDPKLSEASQNLYKSRLVYDFPAIRSTTDEFKVPNGAGDLLKTKFPNLTDAQRDLVIKATGLPSGQPLDRSYQGETSWERVNLVAAFDADVSVNDDGVLVVNGKEMDPGEVTPVDPTLKDPYDSVNMWIGTYHDKSQNKGNDAYGNTWPGATLPFGMVQFTPTTFRTLDSDQRGGYEYSADKLRGFGMTRLNGTGCMGNNGAFETPLLTYTGSVGANGVLTKSPGSDITSYYMPFTHSGETGEPGYYSVKLNDGVNAELAATTRTTVGRFTFPEGNSSATLLFNASGSNNKDSGDITDLTIDPANRTISGSSISKTVCAGGKSKIYFSAQFDKDFNNFGTWSGSSVNSSATTVSAGGKDQAGAYLAFTPGQTVVVKTGISYVSVENAALNRTTETDGKSFDDVRSDAKTVWTDALGRVDAKGGAQDLRTVFYSGLYRALLQPNTYSDVNGQYRGYGVGSTLTGDVQQLKNGQGAEYVTYSSWDQFRSQSQLLALLFPERASDMNQSITNMAQQTGTWYNWPHLGSAQNKMQGDGLQLALASMDAFGATNYDRVGAIDSMISTQGLGPSFNSTRRGAIQWAGVGWIEDRNSVATSTTLDLAMADFAIAQMATRLGKDSAAEQFMARSQNWRNLVSQDSAYPNRLVPRDRKGFWASFDLSKRSYSDGKPDGGASNDQFDQSTGLQYQWLVPHDMAGLIDKLGGKAAARDKLDSLLVKLDDSGVSSNYAYMSNQPTMQLPWVYNWLGAPNKATEIVDRAFSEMYFPDAIVNGKPGLPGNDDLGSFGSWLVWAGIGLYPSIYGRAELSVSAPKFDEVTISPEGADHQIKITADGASTNRTVTDLKVNGVSQSKAWLPEDFARNGGTLDYTLTSDSTSNWGTADQDLPPSFPGDVNGFNSVGTTVDGTANGGALEFSANTLSRNLLAAAGSGPGKTYTWNGIEFPWKAADPTFPDHWIPWGQVVDMGGAYAKRISFLGLATNGPSQGTAKVNYADGTSQNVPVYLTDWTPTGAPGGGNTAVIKMDYRNTSSGGPNNITNKVQVFATAPVDLDATKAITSVTLPNDVTKGVMHLFSIGLEKIAPPAPTEVSPVAPSRVGNAVAIPVVEGVVYQGSDGTTLTGSVDVPKDGTLVVKAVPADGFVFPDGATTQWSFAFQPVAPTVVSPVAPLRGGNTVGIPVVEGVVYQGADGTTLTGSVAVPEGGLTIKAVPADGFAFPDGATTQWSFAFQPVAPTVVSPVAPLRVGNAVAIPVVEGVVYQSADGTTLTGSVDVPKDGTLVVKAVAADGFVFPEGATTEWSFDFEATPPTEPVVVRHGGLTRYDTSFEVAREVLVAGKPLFVATGTNFPDALAGGAAAAHVDGALILVGSKVPDATLALLGEKKPSEVYVLGGSGAVSELVVSQLQTATGVTPVRLSGKNRFETASKVASTFFAGATCAYVASGDNFPDALAASGKAGRDGCPIILFGRGTADLPATANSVFIVGGKGVIPEAYKSGLEDVGMSVTRLAGLDRFGTSQALQEVGASEVWVANGFSFPDALSAAAPSGKAGATMVLAKTNCIPLGAKPAIGANTIKVHLVGGNGALNQNVAALKYCDN